MKQIKTAYPGLQVTATDVTVAEDGRSLFVAFEGQASASSPFFRGVDVFRFDERGSKVVEVDVYRSNWQGAAGHAQRKAQREAAAGKDSGGA